MRLHTITVRNYRRHKELRVDLDRARTLIGGPNESGKSTLVEAVHRALFLKAKGNTEVHRRMDSLTHAGKPEVELEFEAGGQCYSLQKCFKGGSGTVRLAQTGGGSWQGDEAEERLALLLKTVGSIRKPLEQWGHLWVWQGSSANDPLAQAEAERDTLVERLQAQGGAAVIQSTLDTQMASYFATQVETIFKANGDPKVGSDYGRAQLALAEAQADEEAARRVQENLQQAITQHELATTQMGEAEAALKRLETGRASLELRRSQISALSRQEENEARLADDARRTYEGRLTTEQQVLQIRDSLTRGQTELTPQRARLEVLQLRVITAREATAERAGSHEQAEDALRMARSRYDLALALATWAEKTRLHARLKDRAEQVLCLKEKRAGLETRLAALPKVDALALRKLQTLERAQDSTQAVLASVATEIELVVSGSETVRLGAERLSAGQKRTLTTETELIMGSTSLRIRPGGGTTLAEARQQVQDCQLKLEEFLTALGVNSLTDASKTVAERDQHQAEIKALNAELKGLGADQIDAELEAARCELTTAQAEAERRRGPDEPATMSLAETQRELAETENQLQLSRRLRDQSQQELTKAERELTTQAESMRQMERDITEQQMRLSLLMEREGDDAARALAIQQSLAKKTVAEAALETTRQALAQHQPQHLTADQTQFDRAWKAQGDKKNSAHERRIAAATFLRHDGSSDPVAVLALAEARTQSAHAHCQALARQAQALRRVHQLIQEEQQSLADQFTRPLADRVSGYLQRLFGQEVQVQVTMLGSAFEKLTLTRNGQGSFAFESLSNGAREQVSAAFRLALAEILAESHDGCLPVVFDDAFAHSDPERVQALQRMLDLSATRGLQIILLTCTPGDYAMLGASEVNLI